jgi:hypothetical protein
MGSLRPNEELLLVTTRSVAELGDDDIQKLNLQKTVAVTYWRDEKGNMCSDEGPGVRDEELEAIVRTENYYVADHLLGGLSLSMIEQDGNFPEHPHRHGGKGRKRKGRKRKGRERRGFEWGKEQRFICGVWKTAGCGLCDYEYWVKVPCGREWCPECGKPGSLYHRRLYLKTLYVATVMWAKAGAVGYLVITCPEELREKWKDPDKIRRFMEGLRKKLQSLGLWPALYRWHFAGDKGRCWYPHLNILVPMAFVDEEKLENLRRYLSRKGIRIIHYQYTREIGKIRHIARYVSRPTWILQDEVSPERFKYFRKWGVWGKDLLGIKGRITPPSSREAEEFWTLLAVLVAMWSYEEKGGFEGLENVGNKDPDKLIEEFLRVLREYRGEEAEELVEEALKDSRGDWKNRPKRFLIRLMELLGYPRIEEVVGFTVLHGRCIGCFQKLKWKWGKKPFVTSDYKVFKVGWGVWVFVDKNYEPEEFPF